ncbi:Di-sulfide bridge nucleocytoplasmic transport domain-containing protein [Cercophora newfieldiana]|uniref:Di-sulfide bridge nucleocytoplasmic transport domain-containing protein n=1 Tax=Cercophora newfieldiana TaxID=92897 RepID=A0AA39YPB7_9PEZI|nr:Di-sulfide bridge nucleocytoplasmic transport domain-containing protein [Cercophora newfieldiana]
MDRRGFEGPMDWEYENHPPVDPSSPFITKTANKPRSFFDPPQPQRFGASRTNLFGVDAAPRSSPLKSQTGPQPPRSFFNPAIQNKPSAPQFRNPAFTTPQKRVDELAFSEYSGAESSPAMTDISERTVETPDADREDDFGKMTITPHNANRVLFNKNTLRSRTPGRGEVPRGNRDKVRKRKRLPGDRDVGSVRSRLPHASDDSDSDWEDGTGPGGANKTAKTKSWLSSFLAVVSDHPSAPAILSKWLQLGVNLVLMSLVIIGMVYMFLQVRADLVSETEKARSDLLYKMSLCKDNYLKNQCAPKANRAPILEGPCNEWEACMNQDPLAVMKVQLTVRNIGNVLNEFTDVMSFKTWGFLLSMILVAIVGTNVCFSSLRESTLTHTVQPQPSQPAAPPLLGAAQHNPRQAYIWAPISETPRHVRRNLLIDDATDTDNSPEVKALMPPQTPQARRSPSKGERGRSPTKVSRSPSKGY